MIRLTTTRKCRVPTPLGWGLLTVAVGMMSIIFILLLYPFLAPTQPVKGEILVAEGWLPDYALENVKTQFLNDNYKLLVTTGEKFSTDHPLAHHKTSANWAALRLKKQGISIEKILPIATTIIHNKDRTYHKAMAVKKKLNEKVAEEFIKLP